MVQQNTFPASLKKSFSGLSSKRLAANREAEAHETAEKPAVDFEMNVADKDRAKMVSIINTAAKSETGKKVMETAAKAGYKLEFVFAMGSNGGCSKQKKTIILSPMSKPEELVGVLVHESRHAGQFENGVEDACDENRIRKLDSKSDLMLNRATEADAQATCAQAMWELFEQDEIEPFRAFARLSPEIADAFGKTVQKDEKAVENGTARTEAFKAWYDNSKIKLAYENAYNVAIMDHHRETGQDAKNTYDKSLSGRDVLDLMCVDEKNGGTYFSDDPAVIESGKYVDVDAGTKRHMEDYFANRKKVHGLAPDKSLPEIPVREKDELSAFSMKRRRASRKIAAYKKDHTDKNRTGTPKRTSGLSMKLMAAKKRRGAR